MNVVRVKGINYSFIGCVNPSTCTFQQKILLSLKGLKVEMLNAFKQALTSTAKPVAIYVVINYTGEALQKG